MRNHFSLLILSFAWAGGCSTTVKEPDLSAILSRPDYDGDGESPDRKFDFGTVLAHGQSLRHEFKIFNPSDLPIRLVNAIASAPCCSAVGTLPPSIPPHGAVAVPVALKAGYESSPKHVRFIVETDSKARPLQDFAVAALLLSEWEVRSLDDQPKALLKGQPGKRRFELVCRRKGDEGLSLPGTIRCTGDLSAALTGPRTELLLGSSGVIESRSVFEVALPPRGKEGAHRAELLLDWGGKTSVYHLNWFVVPHISLSPPSLIMATSRLPVSREVLLESRSHPFRVVGISGETVRWSGPTSREAKGRHGLKIDLDLTKVKPGTISKIQITTDHPEQRDAVLNVLVLPAGSEKGDNP